MISRRNVIAGLAAAALTGCSAPQAPRQASVAPDQYPQTPPPQTPPPEYPIAPAPPRRTLQGLDAVIDISAHTTVSDFRLVRASNILAVIHKASEGDFYADPMCAERRSQAEAAGLLWGTYHFGKGDSSGAQQAAFFLESSRPGPRTLLALDLEPNEGDPSNSMTLEQAEAFVQAVASATAAPGSRPTRSSRAAAFGSLTTIARLRSRGPGQRAVGGSGNMPATSMRVAAPAAATESSRVWTAAIATCSMATWLRSTGFGMPPLDRT